ncbi:MAG TPA: SH3 domain-containing protein [Spirochaetota bacterium]|nr:SH3 domain-containing protein [Spirochaetota bacterium]HPC43455.1 SH3 domain-containing protein [Spirochaetota bacterium]HPL16165.1 SH3 domain-containing protein [Spirochaetota bacterium]HQF07341.1 SH3 domain-containing protein [Spirochaetota bacterium]HQH96242.1 SH3 domain-containing protein [Spirochaetota bacterium]
MKKNINLMFILVLVFVCGCATNSSKQNGMNILYVTSDNGLVLREKPNRQSKRIVVIPYNSRLQVIDGNGPTDTIDNNTGVWIKVRYKDMSGWVFGGYTSTTKIQQPGKIDTDRFKNSTWGHDASGFGGINIEFDSMNNFVLNVSDYKIDPANPRENYSPLYGEWKIVNDSVILTFRCNNKKNCDYRDLILNEKGRKYYEGDGMTILSKNVFSFNKNTKYIYFFGMSCIKSEPIIQDSSAESRKWSTPSLNKDPNPRPRVRDKK